VWSQGENGKCCKLSQIYELLPAASTGAGFKKTGKVIVDRFLRFWLLVFLLANVFLVVPPRGFSFFYPIDVARERNIM
jgi:hypothetical protein